MRGIAGQASRCLGCLGFTLNRGVWRFRRGRNDETEGVAAGTRALSFCSGLASSHIYILNALSHIVVFSCLVSYPCMFDVSSYSVLALSHTGRTPIQADPAAIPACPACGAARRFEFQVIATRASVSANEPLAASSCTQPRLNTRTSSD